MHVLWNFALVKRDHADLQRVRTCMPLCAIASWMFVFIKFLSGLLWAAVCLSVAQIILHFDIMQFQGLGQIRMDGLHLGIRTILRQTGGCLDPG
jgi:hypothetical protein